MSIIRTVLGDIPADSAGITLTHEHIRYAYPGCETDFKNVWDFEEAAADITKQLTDYRDIGGWETIVDLTPAEIGRHPELMAETSRRSGVNIVATTGFFPQDLGILTHWKRQDVDYLTEMLVHDITVGMVYDYKQTPYKAGIMKAATGGWGIGREGLGPIQTPPFEDGRRIGFFERKAIKAIGAAQRATGVAINTHTQPQDYAVTNPGIELIDLLEAEGVDPARIIIGHALIHPQLDQIFEILKRGACIQIDHIGIPWQHASQGELDTLLAQCIVEMAEAGYNDRIVFSFDRFFHHSRGPITEDEPEQLNEIVQLSYLFREFTPRLEKLGYGEAELRQVLVDNPKRLLAFDPA